MKEEAQTREKLKMAAKEEFLEKGYAKASLRSICKNAEVTTGALYFFFQDKEDLFGSLVEEPIEALHQIMMSHYKEELENKDEIVDVTLPSMHEEEAVDNIVKYMFKNHDLFVLLFTRSHGSKYENCIEQFIEITEQHYRIITDFITEANHKEPVDDYTIHWFSHLQIYSFVQLITHNLTEEQALKQMRTIVKFFINGWLGILYSSEKREK